MKIIITLVVSSILFSCTSEKVKPTGENIVSSLEQFRKQTKKGVFDPYSIYDISGENPGIQRDQGFLNYRRWYCAKDKVIQTQIENFVNNYCESKNGFSVSGDKVRAKTVYRAVWCHARQSGQPIFGVEVGRARLVSKPSDTPFCTSGHDVGVLAYTREDAKESSQWLSYLSQKYNKYDRRWVVFNENNKSGTHVLSHEPLNSLTIIPLYESVAHAPTSADKLAVDVFSLEYTNLRNEFERKKFFEEFVPVVKSTIDNVDKGFEYKISATTKLGSYNFEKEWYPTGLSSGAVIRISDSNYVIKIANLGRGVNVAMNKEIAPTLLRQLPKSRRLSVEIYGKIKFGKVMAYSYEDYGRPKPYAATMLVAEPLTVDMKTLFFHVTRLSITNPKTGAVIYESVIKD